MSLFLASLRRVSVFKKRKVLRTIALRMPQKQLYIPREALNNVKITKIIAREKHRKSGENSK